MTPFDTGAYASSTTYVSGNAVRKAAEEVKKQIIESASKYLEEPIEDLYVKDEKVISKRVEKK